MEYLPVFLLLDDRLAVVIGGGEVARRKVELLSKAGAKVRVVAPEPGREVAALAAGGWIEYVPRDFVASDLDGADLVVAATDRPEINQAVAAAAKARHIPVNVVDQPHLCSFIMPAVVDRGRIVAAVSTGGASPVLARLIRARIELALPPGVERLADLAADWRERVREALPDEMARRRFWERLFAAPAAELQDPEQLLALAQAPSGMLAEIEVPLDDPEAVTLRAVRLLQSADLVLVDAGVPQTILDFARRDARIMLFERGVDQPEIGPALAAGELVVRLTSVAVRPPSTRSHGKRRSPPKRRGRSLPPSSTPAGRRIGS